ncbi:QDE-2-interacting protein [Apiospora saccharicola]
MRIDDTISRDAVFVSLDLEGAENKTNSCTLDTKPNVRQIGIATLDTRDIQRSLPSADVGGLIIGSKHRDRQCDLTPARVYQEDVAATIVRGINIRDGLDGVGSNALRNIILVGYNIGSDLSFLRRLGLDVASIAPVLFVLETHSLSRRVSPPYSPTLPVTPGQDFSLAGLLARFGFRPAPSGFHSAANDAMYILIALIYLTIESGEKRRQQLNPAELGGFTKLEKLVPWWNGSAEQAFRLSAGLWGVASRVLHHQARG